MFKKKSLIVGVAAAIAVAGLTIASLAVTTTSGAGTDDTDVNPVPTNVPATTPATTPPQSPIEPPADSGIAPTGSQAGAGALPSAGYGDTGSNAQNTMLLLGLAGAVLAAGTALMFAGGRAPGRK